MQRSSFARMCVLWFVCFCLPLSCSPVLSTCMVFFFWLPAFVLYIYAWNCLVLTSGIEVYCHRAWTKYISVNKIHEFILEQKTILLVQLSEIFHTFTTSDKVINACVSCRFFSISIRRLVFSWTALVHTFEISWSLHIAIIPLLLRSKGIIFLDRHWFFQGVVMGV
jgi:hypothetical protein